MKNITKILLGVGVAASLVACKQKADYVTESYVTFVSSSMSVDENAGSLEIPVYAYTNNGGVSFPRTDDVNTSVTFEVVNGTATEGVDFTVEPANGVLTFSGSSESSIKVNVNNRAGERTGDLSFTIRFTGASDGYTLGGAREATVTIKDMDHPLANILGTYTASGISIDTPYTWTLNMSMDETDESIVWIDLLVPFAEPYVGYVDVMGVVSDDLSTITIHVPVESDLLYDEGDPFVFCEYMGNLRLSTEEADIVLVTEDQKTFTTSQGICFVPLQAMAAYYGALIEPGTLTLTKQ